jgi:hypothetical protein
MYLHLGSQMAVRERAVIGIFDLDNTTASKHTRAFLEKAQAEGALIDVSDELPKAFVLTEEYGMTRVYLTQLGAATLQRRLEAARSGNL